MALGSPVAPADCGARETRAGERRDALPDSRTLEIGLVNCRGSLLQDSTSCQFRHNVLVLVLRVVGFLVVAGLIAGCSEDSPQPQPGSQEYPAYLRSSGPDPDLSLVRLRDDLPDLGEDRRVRAVLEIDRARDLPMLSLATSTRDGPVDLAGILADVGIDVEVVWSDTLPRGELVDDPWPGETHLCDLMARYRNVPVDDDRWYFYLLLGRKTQPDRELSLLIDPEARTGAVVFVDPDPEEKAATLHAVGHEIGHLLNLPHPWDVYGNTRSLMSYPWRWIDWDWGDPAVFRIDEAGSRFVLRAPEEAVRPGRGGFAPTVE